MAEKLKNTYQVKFKLTPNRPGYKSSFVSGLVIARNQPDAIALGSKNIEKSLEKEPFSIGIKVQSIVKLRQDFFFVGE